MIYCLYLALLFICSLYFDFGRYNRKINRGKNWYTFCLVIITLIVGLRYNIGADTCWYSYNYPSFSKLGAPSLFDSSNYQPGWIVIEATFRSLSSNFVYLQFFVAFFINLVFFKFIWKLSVYPFLTLIIYFVINFFEFDTEILRESVAICIGLLMYEQLQKNKYIYSIGLLLLAFSIHMSAAVLLLMLFLTKIPLNKLTAVISVVICLFAFVIWTSNSELSMYLDLIAYRNEGKIESYFENYEVGDWNIYGQIVHYIKFLILPCTVLYFASKNKQKKYSLVIFGYMLFGVLSHNSNAFLRASNYYVPFYWLIITDAVQYLYNRYRFLRNGFVIIAFCILLYVYLYESRLLYGDNDPQFEYVYERYFPYKTVLDPENSYSVTIQ